MAVTNPGLDNLATNQRLIKNKIHYVLSTYLGEEVSAYNTRHGLSGAQAVLYPRTINLNVNTMDLRFGTDQFPALSVIPAGSTVSPNIYHGSQDVILDYEIVVAAVSDSADIDYTAEQSNTLGLLVADVLEKYLPECPGRSGVTSVYKVDQVKTQAGRPQSFGTGMFLLSTLNTIRVFSRAQMNWTPAYVSSSYEYKPSVPSNFVFSGSVDWRADAVSVGSAEESNMVSISMGAGDTLDLYFSGTNIPSGSSASYVIRRDLKFVDEGALPFTGGEQSIPLTFDTTPQTGDVVNVIINVSGSQNELNYPAKLTIT
jgi:hypothetical protein